jgi:anhydro-N-acetylmuramic acid kinase
MFLTNKIILGIMSGSSLDGLDIGAFKFNFTKNGWAFEIIAFKTFAIPEKLKSQLINADKLEKTELNELDILYGKFISECIIEFNNKHNLNPELIGVHGHTVFHEPKKGFSLQLGNGKIIAEKTNITTVSDFRNEDIQKGGQGAPLVPIGDNLLFRDYDACINLGGIANVTLKDAKVAFDIYYCNRALNYLSNKLGFEYDKNGTLSKKGKINRDLLIELNRIKYLKLQGPKSLNNQDFERFLIPIFNQFKNDKTEDLLRTYIEFLADLIAFSATNCKNILVTGGGAHNSFFMEILQKKSNSTTKIPDSIITDSKEALIFAFMALLKKEGKTNVISYYTGAYKDSSAGKVDFSIG